MDTKGRKPRWGGDGGVLNRAIGIDMYTLICIKLMTNKNRQYKKTNKQTSLPACVHILVLLLTEYKKLRKVTLPNAVIF